MMSAHVMLESGRPALVVPFAGHYPGVGRRVVVAWNGTREAARALNDAIPLVLATGKVHVAMLHRPRERIARDQASRPSVARHLAAHGVTAEYEPLLVDETPSPPRSAAADRSGGGPSRAEGAAEQRRRSPRAGRAQRLSDLRRLSLVRGGRAVGLPPGEIAPFPRSEPARARGPPAATPGSP